MVRCKYLMVIQRIGIVLRRWLNSGGYGDLSDIEAGLAWSGRETTYTRCIQACACCHSRLPAHRRSPAASLLWLSAALFVF
jgi:hypothetical protein